MAAMTAMVSRVVMPKAAVLVEALMADGRG
jgi:hypothetical protein